MVVIKCMSVTCISKLGETTLHRTDHTNVRKLKLSDQGCDIFFNQLDGSVTITISSMRNHLIYTQMELPILSSDGIYFKSVLLPPTIISLF